MILPLLLSVMICIPASAQLRAEKAALDSDNNRILATNGISVEVSGKLALCSHSEKGSIILDVKGGLAPYTYRWNTLETTKDRTNLFAGTYTVEITDAAGTVHIERIVVQPPYPLILNPLEKTDASCGSGNDGSAKISVKVGRGEPYQITWSNGMKDTWEVTNLAPGFYSVTIADIFNCDVTTSFEIKAASEGMQVSEVIENLSCSGQNNGSINLDIKGGQAPYTYKWNTGSSSQNLSNLAAGTYSVLIKDQTGCSFQASYSIKEATSIQLEEKLLPESCAGAGNGEIQVTIQGGSAPYTYIWSNGQTSSKLSGATAGNYSLKVTDALGCTVEKHFTLGTASALELELIEQTDISCAGSNSGTIRLKVKGNSGNYATKWLDDPSAGLNRENLSAGTYQLLVSDESGCTVSKSFTIADAEPIQARIETALDVDCTIGTITGVAWVSIQGGVQPYKISWSNGENNAREINFNSSGSLKVQITDALGCTAQTEVRVDFPSQINKAGRLDFDYRKLEINSEPEVQVDEEIIFESIISEEFIGWEWSFGDGKSSKEKDPIHKFEIAGNFEVILTAYDIYGCSSTEKNIIQVNAPLEFITIPNAFTPNGDGLNDMFIPKLRALTEFSMTIFNTWGEKIYSTNSLETKGWDGTHQGQASPPGNYLYQITYTSKDGEQFTKTGGVTLIR
ncbi:gliding motility-associated C-terminal domain-containing protein [Algoriphagus winogradskyi]|uniref:Gliding motility-associated C-terminal domain-containing protein n=1 Tax=Algoriphagus winogradskyi TaxID=237017 RepID=A0ABY1NMZ6_9BACT|nr:gliding motility-associated C-terminal domain-containing protein [Algoriphagus winogradskyi]SMP13892.1 gliding motility-associated C-terminal domain-containing protein [Algoriphagus winogradskyi]